ncbi:MAG: radical SAM protein [Thermodesulfobacteriota bacterium]
MKKTVSFAIDSINVFFHILTRCNLKCRHCYINPEQHGSNSLPLDTICDWLKAFAQKSASANVIFLGGEPTLHPDLPQAIRRAREIGYQSITVDTNGYLFHHFLDRVTPQDVDYISFSLDGATRETNDGIRGRGSYDTCLAGIRQAVQFGFHTSLIFTVSRDNIHELPDMGRILADLGIERFFIQVIGLRGESARQKSDGKKPILPVESRQWLSVIPSVAEEIAGNGVVVTYPKVFLSMEEPFACAGNVAENYFIFPNGRVYQCPLCEDYPLHSKFFIGNRLVDTSPINERNLFQLNIPEGCVMNRLIQPDNLYYLENGRPAYKIACCLLKEEVRQKT